MEELDLRELLDYWSDFIIHCFKADIAIELTTHPQGEC
jgi:hypothetical protein